MSADALAALGPHPAPETVDRFLAVNQFPLVDDDGCTFVYHGPAEAVWLRPMVAGLQPPRPLKRIDDTELWYYSLPLPDSARVEYKLEVMENGNGRWIDDPLNPRRTSNPFGTNSVAHARSYRSPEWVERGPRTPAGRLEDLVVPSKALPGPRRVTIYLPAGFPGDDPYPLVVVHDGGDYLRFGGLAAVLDNLIDRGEVAPSVVALTHPVERLEEYGANPDHARFVTVELIPWLERCYPLSGRRVVMGASMGAVAALHIGATHPDRFDAMLLQSGTFVNRSGEGRAHQLLEPVVSTIRRLNPARLPRRVFLSCGRFEALITQNRELAARFRRAGLEFRYEEADDGHNWEGWRDRLRDGLTWVLPAG